MPKASKKSLDESKSPTIKAADSKKGKQKENAASSEKKDNTENAVDSTAIRVTIDNLEEATMGTSWKEALAPEFKKAYFSKLKAFLIVEYNAGKVFPKAEDIYSWSRLTPLDDVKVIVVGQDPYHDDNQAHGLSFSVLPPTKPPPSLRNIYKQLAADIPGFVVPKTGDLTPLAKSGVLWLNTSLTVRAHKAGSHTKKGWESLTAAALKAVLDRENNQGVVIMAWGSPAQKTCEKLEIDEEKHLVLRSVHPSPLSANKGFIGNEHFRKANEWLKEKHGKEQEVDWMSMSQKE